MYDPINGTLASTGMITNLANVNFGISPMTLNNAVMPPIPYNYSLLANNFIPPKIGELPYDMYSSANHLIAKPEKLHENSFWGNMPKFLAGAAFAGISIFAGIKTFKYSKVGGLSLKQKMKAKTKLGKIYRENAKAESKIKIKEQKTTAKIDRQDILDANAKDKAQAKEKSKEKDHENFFETIKTYLKQRSELKEKKLEAKQKRQAVIDTNAKEKAQAKAQLKEKDHKSFFKTIKTYLERRSELKEKKLASQIKINEQKAVAQIPNKK